MSDTVWSESLYDSCGCPPDKGHSHARRFPKPLRPLTPETSDGFMFIAFCMTIGFKLLPWQKWLAIHALERVPEGRYRFRTLCILLARQQGKSTFMALLIAWKLTVKRRALILGAAQNLQTAEEVWESVVDLIQSHPTFSGELSRDPSRVNGSKAVFLTGGRRYMPIAATGGAGRGLSPDDVLLDEIREHRTWEAWAALSKATMAIADAQIWAVTNAGEAKSIVLNHLTAQGLDLIREDGEEGVGLFDWSAFDPDDSTGDPDSFESWRRANPSMGYTITKAAIADARATDPPGVFLTEVLCVPVAVLDAVIDVASLIAYADPVQHTLEPFVGQRAIYLHLDVTPDLRHAVLYGAVPHGDGRVKAQLIRAWAGTETIENLREELPKIVKAIGAREIGRYVGNTGAQATNTIWKGLRGLTKREYNTESASAHAVRFDTLVSAGRVLQPGDTLLVTQARAAERQQTGDTWRFKRISKAGQYVDALYAAAGACAVAEEKGKLGAEMMTLDDIEGGDLEDIV